MCGNVRIRVQSWQRRKHALKSHCIRDAAAVRLNLRIVSDSEVPFKSWGYHLLQEGKSCVKAAVIDFGDRKVSNGLCELTGLIRTGGGRTGSCGCN